MAATRSACDTGARSFLGGVVEGFYGQPWTHAQRLLLLEQLAAWGFNAYFYAPKDDLKHRAVWRQVYTDRELALLSELVDACRQRGIEFVYGLSPGLDMRFSDAGDRQALQERIVQMQNIGCTSFGLLFDDLPGALAAEDQRRYPSLAHAHCDVANAALPWVRQREPNAWFLFCPTPYCGRMDAAGHGGPEYLSTLGSRLDASIDVLWTGPEIVSKEISVESLVELSRRIGRKPVLWDNLHANDYDYRRLYCGPYAGRSAELRAHVRGILSNPNNEFPVNFIPLRTLAAYLYDSEPRSDRDRFLEAAREWLEAYTTIGESLAFEDLTLLADCFYLPHSDGPEAQALLETIRRLIETPCSSWEDAENKFHQWNGRIQALSVRLTELRNRELFYAWSRRAWDLKEEMALLTEFVAHKKLAATSGSREPFASAHYLPGTYRGGLLARMQRLLPIDEQGVFHPPTTEPTPGLASHDGACA